MFVLACIGAATVTAAGVLLVSLLVLLVFSRRGATTAQRNPTLTLEALRACAPHLSDTEACGFAPPDSQTMARNL